MTLKEFLENHKILCSPNQRSKIGLLISSKNDSNGRVIEEGYNVKDYKESFLESKNVTDIIINFLK